MDDEQEPPMSNGFLIIGVILILLAAAMAYVKYSTPIVVPKDVPIQQSVKDPAPEPHIYERDVKG